MIDLPLLEQIDRMLWAAAIGMLAVSLWYLVVRLLARRGFWRGLLEAVLLGLVSLLAAAAVFVGTLGDLRSYVFVAFALGATVAGGLLQMLRAPWQETRRRRRI